MIADDGGLTCLGGLRRGEGATLRLLMSEAGLIVPSRKGAASDVITKWVDRRRRRDMVNMVNGL